jgi:Holliday junction resolvasome RuvABC endonuclease subunit
MSNKTILALDVATHCGWKTTTASGVWNLTPKRDESSGMRLIRFKSKLAEICQLEKINLVVFERSAGFHMNAVIVQSELHGVLKLYLEESRIEYKAYSATEIKKFATGKGNANKDKMVEAARTQFGYTGFDDNEADAICMYHLALQDFKFIK